MNKFSEFLKESAEDFFEPLVDWVKYTHRLSGKISTTFQIPITIIMLCADAYILVEIARWVESYF